MKLVTEKDLVTALYHSYHLGERLLWALTIHPEDGLREALKHLKFLPGLAEWLSPSSGEPFVKVLEDLVAESATVMAQPFEEEGRGIREKFSERVVRLKLEMGTLISHAVTAIELEPPSVRPAEEDPPEPALGECPAPSVKTLRKEQEEEEPDLCPHGNLRGHCFDCEG